MMEKAGDEDSIKFINALIKSVQSLCHGFLDFQHGIEIIGHINISVDNGNSLDYILKEKVCKSDENSTSFISNSFEAKKKTEDISGQNSKSTQQHNQTDACVKNHSSVTPHHGRKQLKRRASKDWDREVLPMKTSLLVDDPTCIDSEYSDSSSPVDSKTGLRDLMKSRFATCEFGKEQILETPSRISNHFKSTVDIGVSLEGHVLEPVEDHGRGDLDDDVVTIIKEEHDADGRSAYEDSFSGQHFLDSVHNTVSDPVSSCTPTSAPASILPSSSSSRPSSFFVSSAHSHGCESKGKQNKSSSQLSPGLSNVTGSQRSSQPTSISQVRHQSEPRNTSPLSSCQQQKVSGNELILGGCQFCAIQFFSVVEMSQHLCNAQIGKKGQHFCTICCKSIIRKQDFEDHMNRHRNIKAHVCPYCSMQFTFKNNLRQHVRSAVCQKGRI